MPSYLAYAAWVLLIVTPAGPHSIGMHSYEACQLSRTVVERNGMTGLCLPTRQTCVEGHCLMDEQKVIEQRRK